MEIAVQRQQLVRALGLAASVADKGSTLPILSHALLRAQDGRLEVTGYDLQVCCRASMEAAVQQPGDVAIRARVAADVVKAMTGDQVVIRTLDNEHAEVKCGKSRYKLVGVGARDFPKLPASDGAAYFPVTADVLGDLLQKVGFAMSTDDSRYHLCGAFLKTRGTSLSCSATDGHRLADAERICEVDLGKLAPGGVIVPRKGVAALIKMLDGFKDQAVEVGIKGDCVFVKTPAWELSCKLVEAQFPPIDSVVPKKHSWVVEVPVQGLMDAIKRVKFLTSSSSGVRLTFSSDGLVIAADDPEQGEGREELDVEFGGVKPLELCLNATYLLDVLGQVIRSNELASFCLTGELDPVLIHPVGDPNYRNVVMPMRM